MTNAVEIQEIYGSEFIYNGITKIYDHDKEYNIRYDSTVKVGIDASSLQDGIQIDEKNKSVSITIPEIRIMEVIVDPGSLEYLPGKPPLSIKEILRACETDAIKGAKSETLFSNNEDTDLKQTDLLLFDIAEENICDAIEGIVSPLLEGTGYSLDFYRTTTTTTTEVIR